MIRAFKCEETERIFHGETSSRFPADIHRPARKRLYHIEAANVITDLRVPPGNRLEKLHGNREGQYSIRVNDQWRICFEWREDGAYEVEIVDYH